MKNFDTESLSGKKILFENGSKIIIFKFMLGFILSLFIASMSFSATPYCSNIFQNGLQTHGVDGFINFGKNSRLIHPYDTRLNTPAVTMDPSSVFKTCGKRECTAAGTPVDGLLVYQKDILPERDANAPDNQTTSIGSNEHHAFRQVLVGNNATAIFVPNTHYYIIDTLKLGYKSTLQLPAGDYWINQFSTRANSKIEIIGEGQVTLYIRDDFKLPLNFKINENTKDPSRISIYTYANSEYGRGSRTYAFIRSQAKATLKNQARIDGGLLANSITLESSSIVVFDANAVDNMSFNYFCSGFVPYVDVTPPQIIAQDFFDTRDPTFTFTGTIKDPGGIKKATVSYGDTELLLTLTDEKFSIELPLSVGENIFYVTAVDESGNGITKDFYAFRRSIEGFAFLFDEYDYYQTSDRFNITGTLNVPEGHTIKNAVAHTVSGDIPIQVDGNRYSVVVPVIKGSNKYVLVAVDQYGNEATETMLVESSNGAGIFNFKITPEYGKDPVRVITGEIHSFWPMETLVATLKGEPLELIRVTDTVSRFEKTVKLSATRHLFDLRVVAPSGESVYEELYVEFNPDRIDLSITAPLPYTFNETVVIPGSLHLTEELIGVVTGLVVTSDQRPGVEVPIDLIPVSEFDFTFSVVVSLVVGENNLLFKVKQGTEDLPGGLDYSQKEFTVERYSPE